LDKLNIERGDATFERRMRVALDDLADECPAIDITV
jgi:hypothetical protein